MDRIGQLLEGKYRIVRLLGEGGMGAVYIAEHMIIGNQVAIKFLQPELARNPEVVHRFIQEARAAAAVGHQGIVKVFDVGASPDGSPFLVMELLDGETLRSVMDRERLLPVPFAAQVAVAVLSALAAAHRKGIVHRDIKPDNIFLERTPGNGPSVKLLDFGISKMMQAGLTLATRTGVAMGTPQYMAPEQARGESDVDLRVDIYAMGVMLYEALTGALPLDAANYNAMILRVATEVPRPPKELRTDLPDALNDVIVRALAKDREDRYDRCEDLMEALLPFAAATDQAGLDGEETVVVAKELVQFTSAPTTPAALQVFRSGNGTTEPEPLFRSNLPAGAAPVGTTPHAWESANPPSSRSVRRVTWVVVAALVVVAAATAFFLAVTSGGSGARSGEWASQLAPPVTITRPVTAVSGGAIAPPRTSAGGRGTATGSPSAAEQPRAVVIELEGIPAGARVYLAGSLVTQLPIRIPAQNVAVLLQVEADGYQTFSQMVLPSQDLRISVAMTARTERAPRDPAHAKTVVRGDASQQIRTTNPTPPGPASTGGREGRRRLPIQTDTSEFGPR